ncbi:fungal-specific transcription factor domain-containing protein [Aspergillus floccosus]
MAATRVQVVALKQATETVHRQAAVLQLLFPHATLDALVDKDRAELIRLLSQPSSTDTGLPAERFGVVSSVSESPGNGHGALDESDEADDSEDRHWDESAKDPAALATSDDINAIGLAGDRRRRSYLGICSVGAVLKALFRHCPGAKDRIIEDSKLWPPVQADDTRPTLLPQGLAMTASSDSLRELRYIAFYFDNIHAITPFLHEESFRAKFSTRDQQGSSWLGLCNMVLTVGSIASGSDTAHIHYYNQARSYLDLDSLGSGNLETLQALCLLGGYYLHYRNSPNMAYAILGAAQRLAISLGLHREPPVRTEQPDPEARISHALRLETRRRTWWSLYCLDTWASMTLGRPTCGRWDNATMNTSLPSALHPDDHFASSLGASIEFCHICNRLQHRFAQFTRISSHEAQALDYDLQQWYGALHPALQHTIDTPPRMTVAREFLRNRYYNARLILSRCFLLYMAYEDTTRRHPQPAEQQMASLCRSIAEETIDAIALHWVPNRTQVWNSAWYLFQACMVPLLSIAMANTSDPAVVDPADVTVWYASLHKALDTFSEMSPWMRSSDRAPNIVAVLLQAVSQGPDGSIHTPSVTDGALNLFGMSDEFLIEMDWSELPNDENIFQSLFPLT